MLEEARQLDVPQTEAQQQLDQVSAVLHTSEDASYLSMRQCDDCEHHAALSVIGSRALRLQIQENGTGGHAALRAAVLGMFADNQAGKQRQPLLSCIGISTPAPHNMLKHMRSQLHHEALRCGTLIRFVLLCPGSLWHDLIFWCMHHRCDCLKLCVFHCAAESSTFHW